MSYLHRACLPQHYSNKIESKWAGFNIMSCEKISGSPAHSVFLGTCYHRLHRTEILIRSGFNLYKNNSSVAINHNKVYFTTPAGKVTGQLSEAPSFEKFLAALLAPLAELPLIGQQLFSVQQQTHHNGWLLVTDGLKKIKTTGNNQQLFSGGMFAVPVGQSDRLASSLAEIIQLRAPCFAASNRLNINHIRRMNRKNTLHPLVADYPPHRESLINSTTFTGNHRAAKYLYALFIAFFDAAAHIYNIAYFKMRYIFFEILALNSIQYLSFHLFNSCIIY